MPSTYTGVVNEEHLSRVVRSLFPKTESKERGEDRESADPPPLRARPLPPCEQPRFRISEELKKEEAARRGTTLIVVPCWWPGDQESLLSTIVFERADLSPSNDNNNDNDCFVSPIPLNPSESFFNARQVPDVGELMSASYPPHFSIFGDNKISIEHPWWLGEKYDGIRSCWNPQKQLLFSRTGYSLYLNQSFVKHFPAVFLDGETWFGRGCFPESQQLISSTANWPFLRQTVFDNPKPSTLSEPFESRYTFLLDIVPVTHPFLSVVWRVNCTSKKGMMNMLQRIMDDGGEGVILRSPKSPYVYGRSDKLWKLKATKGDREALVLQVYEDNSCLLQLPDGASFVVTKENSKHCQVKEGDVVTIEYDNVTRHAGQPVNPVLVRVRLDSPWLDVVRQFFLSLPSSRSLNEVSQKLSNYSTKPTEYWTEKKRNKMRKVCEQFARSRGLDPLEPTTWYLIARDFSQMKEANFILLHYKMSVVKALIDLFPEVKLNMSEFDKVTRNYWDNTKHRREFFCEVAKRLDFDPLLPSNWYSVPFSEINKLKGSKAVVRHHGSISNALIHLFPEITFDELKFPLVATIQHHWRDRRKFFIDYAKKMGFDPHVPTNWYSVSLQSVLQHKGAHTILQYYRGRLKQALVTLFPNIGLEKDLFKHPMRAYWLDVNNQRDLMLSLSKELNFDPLIASAWRSVTLDMIKAKKGGKQLMKVYDDNLNHAIRVLFLLDTTEHLPPPKAKRKQHKVDSAWTCYNCKRTHDQCGRDRRKLVGREEEGHISCGPCAFYFARNKQDRPVKLIEKVKKLRSHKQ